MCDVSIAMMYAVLSATKDKPMDAACALLEGYVSKIPLTTQVRQRLLALRHVVRVAFATH